MKEISSKDIKLKEVITKKGVKLYLIEIDNNHFLLEQNPNKDSKYGKAYKLLKEKYPDFCMFWEIKNNRYTGRILMGGIFKKQYIDRFITDVVQSELYKDYEDIKDEIEEYET